MSKIVVSGKVKELIDKYVELENVASSGARPKVSMNEALENLLNEQIEIIETDLKVRANPPPWDEL